jgi:hypothetical protein
MTLHGTIQNGVVVFDDGPPLADGTPVTVLVEQGQPARPNDPPELMSETERLRVLAIIDRIAALPIEGSAEPCSGADHDKVLYGAP